jgi:hypothetical protein
VKDFLPAVVILSLARCAASPKDAAPAPLATPLQSAPAVVSVAPDPVAAIVDSLKGGFSAPIENIKVLSADQKARLTIEILKLGSALPPQLSLSSLFRNAEPLWDRQLESLFLNYALSEEPAIRLLIRQIFANKGLSSAEQLRKNGDSAHNAEDRSQIAELMSRANDVDKALLEHVCDATIVGKHIDTQLTCLAALCRSGVSSAQTKLAKTIARLTSAEEYEAAAARYAWLARELGAKAPWKELSSEFTNMRTAAIIHCLCIDDFVVARPCQCSRYGAKPPLADRFLEQVIVFLQMDAMEGTTREGGTYYTEAQRREVRRALSLRALVAP